MSTRKVTYKPNEYIKPCPECGNNTKFTIHSEQCCEDCCEIWAVCNCGYDLTSYENFGSGNRIEDVWGGCSDDNCKDAIDITWNELIEELNDERIATQEKINQGGEAGIKTTEENSV